MEDLRIIKTKKAIKDAFIAERKTKELNEIRVKTICENAIINKSTFYKHYTDIIDLSNKLQEEAIDAFVDDFEHKDKIFSNPILFIKDFEKVLSKHFAYIYVLFKDDVSNENIFKMLFKVKEKLLAVYEDFASNTEKEILLSFVMSGTFQTLATIKFKQYKNENECYKKIEEIINIISEKYLKI